MSQRNVLYHVFSIVRIFLYPLAIIYGAIMWLRNKLYDAGFSSSIEFSLPVITVGNLSVGGTGKTPHVEHLVRLLQYRYRVATMSRGYKRRTQGFLLADPQTNAIRIGDEPMQYYMKFPELVVSVAEERMTGIPELLRARPDVEVILLDDAYQHRSVKAGLNILITDYSKPFYTDHILPFGTLRESRNAYKRADVIIVSKCPMNMERSTADAMLQHIQPLPHQKVFFTGIRYDTPYDFFSKAPIPLNGRNAVLVCGIAKPGPMIAHLEGICDKVHVLSYADHHYFLSKDLEEMKEAYANWDAPGKVMVTTEKDAARLLVHSEKLKDWGTQIVVLPIAVSVLFGQGTEFDSIVNAYVEKVVAENNEFMNGPSTPGGEISGS